MRRSVISWYPLVWVVSVAVVLSGCSSTSVVRDAVPRPEPYSKYGNPDSYEVLGQRYEVMKDNRGYRETGIASWYGPGFHGKRASAGELYDMYAMTAAHKTLRIPCYVEVTNLQNGKRAVVRVNDRGPFHDNRIIDLSYAAAQKLGLIESGTALVEVRHLDVDQPPPQQPDDAPVQLATPVPEWGRNVFLQVGAFADPNNAERLRLRLASARIDQVNVTRRPDGLHRVRIGPLGSVEQADELARQLDGLGVYGRHIVVD
ncbi:MAG: septal ring lytic transglycosylase RlpA family protein [Gammaproteobacteria bacterium]|nr:septal ring lytic transglycosylase RlpA family protein [Gammaproteobacteria bacterium]